MRKDNYSSRTVCVGDKVVRVPSFLEYGDQNTQKHIDSTIAQLKPTPRRGTVVYVHPKGRFHVVEFANAFGFKYRESYRGVEL